MNDLVSLSLSSPKLVLKDLVFELIESVDENTAIVNINGRQITFIYVWENRHIPHWEYFDFCKIRLGNTFFSPYEKIRSQAYVFYVEAL